MNHELAIVVGLLAIAIAMFAVNKPRMDAVGLIMLTALPLTGVITMSEALADSAIPTLSCSEHCSSWVKAWSEPGWRKNSATG